MVSNAESQFETIVSPLPEKSSFTAKFQVLPKVVNPTFIKNKRQTKAFSSQSWRGTGFNIANFRGRQGP